MERDVSDIIDRYSISKLKAERIKSEESKKEYESFLREVEQLKVKYPEYNWEQFTHLMVLVNAAIWSLEAGLKGGKDLLKNPHYIFDPINKEGLSEIGVIAILIRNINAIRVEFKNIVNTLLKTGFIDNKKDHLSEF